MKNLTFPRKMMVSDEPITKSNLGEKRVVWAYNDFFIYPFLCYPSYIQTIEDIEKKRERREGWISGNFYKYAQDYIEPQIELTLKEIAKKFNINVTQLRIKD